MAPRLALSTDALVTFLDSNPPHHIGSSLPHTIGRLTYSSPRLSPTTPHRSFRELSASCHRRIQLCFPRPSPTTPHRSFREIPASYHRRSHFFSSSIIPAHNTTSTNRRALYVTPSADSLVLFLNPHPPHHFDYLTEPPCGLIIDGNRHVVELPT